MSTMHVAVSKATSWPSSTRSVGMGCAIVAFDCAAKSERLLLLLVESCHDLVTFESLPRKIPSPGWPFGMSCFPS